MGRILITGARLFTYVNLSPSLSLSLSLSLLFSLPLSSHALQRYGDSIYKAPRPTSMEGSVYDIPPARVGPPPPPLIPGMSAEAAIESGLYSVPRNLLNGHEEGAQQLPPPPPNPFDIYDIPRTSMSPDMDDEEGIYDVPLDILDFEIYDYPPDVMELGLEPVDSGLDTTRSSTITVSSDYTLTERASSVISEDSWNIFPGMRPSMAFSTISMASSDDLQVRLASTYLHMYSC